MSSDAAPARDFFEPRAVTLPDGRSLMLRQAEPGDAAALLSYAHASLPDNTPYVLTHPDEFSMTEDDERAWIERHRDKPGALAMLAWAGDAVVGMIGLTTRPDRRRIAHVGELGMSTAKAYWGSGLGSAMMDALITWAEAHPVLGYLELSVYADNERAVRLYRGQGFVEAGRTPRRTRFEDGSARDGVLMYRRVDGTLSEQPKPGGFREELGGGVVLRQVCYGDADALYELYRRNRERFRRYFRWAWRVESAGSFRGMIAEWTERRSEQGVVSGVIESRGTLLGMAYIVHHVKEDKRIDLGYWLDEANEGRGLVTSSCRALIQHGFDQLGVTRVDIFADVDNTRSRAVAERLGFTLEAEIRRYMGFPDGRSSDLAGYRLLREDWVAAGGDA